MMEMECILFHPLKGRICFRFDLDVYLIVISRLTFHPLHTH